MALQQVRYDEQSAVRLFREAVDAKRTAQQLMSMGKYMVWDERQRERAWSDLSKALEDVDAVLADERSLVTACTCGPGASSVSHARTTPYRPDRPRC